MFTPSNQASLRFFLSLATVTLGCITYNSATCHVDDMTGLMAFKGGVTADPTGLLESWKSGTECCKWDHIFCNSKNRVYAINLEESETNQKAYLYGTLPTSLTKVRHLERILLGYHKFSGENLFNILFGLPNIEVVYLQYNRFSGEIPSNIGTLTKLYLLNLKGNLFSGPIPSSIFKWAKLDTLDLSRNFLSGTIPKEIGKLKNLNTLDLSQNQFTGNIPEMFSSFPRLEVINLSHNKLSGKIPSTLCLVPILHTLYLGHNALTGKIPSFFSRNLSSLDLSSNRLSGTVPKTFSKMVGILELDLSGNLLVDPFPQMKGMQWLDLSYNNFQFGDIPKWITTKWVFTFYSLKLAKCGIKIKLDDWKPSDSNFFPSILNIDLSDNVISGSPINLLKQTGQLKEFLISNNKMRFNIESLKFPSSLESLDISKNLVFGKLPRTISGLKNLNVSYNHLCGAIPPTNFSLTSFIGNDCLCGSPLYPCKK